tara:strand:- start:4606 stop:5754 length:1149 start_codon:yes stop_codon:yes gene_type:complete
MPENQTVRDLIIKEFSMSSKIELQVRSRGEFSTLVNQFSDFVKEHKGKPKRNEIIDFLATEFFKKQSHHHLLSPLPEHDFPFVERFSQERRYACELNFFICDTCKRPCSFQEGMVLWKYLKKDYVGTKVNLVHNGIHCDAELADKSLPVPYLTTEKGGKERLMDLILKAELSRDPIYDEATRIDWAVVYGRLNVEGFEELHRQEGGESAIRSYMKENVAVPSLDDLNAIYRSLGRDGDLIPSGAQISDFFGSVLVRASDAESQSVMRSLSQLGSLTSSLPILDAKCFSPDSMVGSYAFERSVNRHILSEPWAVIDLRNVELGKDALDALEVCLWTRESHLYSTVVLLAPQQEFDSRRFQSLNLNLLSASHFKELVDSLSSSS